MRLSKRILKHPRTQEALSWLLAAYIALVYITSRKDRHVHAGAEPIMRGEENAIFAFWHGRMMLLPAFNPPRKMHVLISFHRDGLLISRVISHFRQATISGSSSRGGSQAVKDILRVLKAGDNVSITPDGPRGPVQVVQSGIVTAARLSGLKIMPVTFSATRHRRLRSWDRFMVALPFGRIVFCVGEPISVSRELDETGQEEARRMIEQRMNALTAQADALSGVAEIADA
ncbi:MAG: DUF374 domain-containing protein [Proteobacteria bacterium]|nr:DUF374 domain-containing protein [Pseudomonadota bacterium]